MPKIRILIVEPNKEPRQAKIEHTLHDLQSIVGGLIEYVELEYNVDLICNEEGKIDNLELNRFITNDIIAGTFIIVGQHDGETISLSRKQIKKYKKRFKLAYDKELINLTKRTIVNSSDLIQYGIRGIENVITYKL